jgi:tetratricopeptide (TPR) repeat protein
LEFSGLSSGTYYIVADVPGFKRLNQRIDLRASQFDTSLTFILQPKLETVTSEPMNLLGEDRYVVDVSALDSRNVGVQEEVRKAEELLRDGDIAGAQQRLEAVVQRFPDHYGARNALGTVYQRAGRHRDAEAEYRMAADLMPDSAAPLINLGSLYLQESEAAGLPSSVTERRMLNKALQALQQAVELNPAAVFAYYLMGVTYHRAALYEDAEDNLMRSIELEPRLADARLALANVYIRIHDWPRALSQIDAYLKHPFRVSDLEQIQKTRSQILEELNASGDPVH